jgi:hypothetical protein
MIHVTAEILRGQKLRASPLTIACALGVTGGGGPCCAIWSDCVPGFATGLSHGQGSDPCLSGHYRDRRPGDR